MKGIVITIFIFLTLRLTGQLPDGDLLFQDQDCGPFCDAIERVTEGVDGLDFSHVGIVYNEEEVCYVLEAGGAGVVKTPLDSFLNRSLDAQDRPKVVVGRLKSAYRYTIPAALERSLNLLGRKYDEVFDIGNDSYYCSELVYFAFRDSMDAPLFELRPMTFRDPETQQTFPVWADYFRELQTAIPEGQPGLNPGSISRSDKLEIVYRYF